MWIKILYPQVQCNKLDPVTLGLVREQEAGLQVFLSNDGFSLLMRGMQSENEKLRTKSAFLLLNLLMSHPEHKGKKGSLEVGNHLAPLFQFV